MTAVLWPEQSEDLLCEAFTAAVAAESVGLDPENRIDPLQRLFDPEFTDVFWDYDHSKIGMVPGKLHRKQLEALDNQSIHRWLFWSNQSGKTTLAAIDMVLSALGRHPLQLAGVRRMPPFTGWASGLSWEMWEKTLLPELLTWIPPWRLIKAPTPHVHSINRDIVILADNGRESRITGKAAEQGADKYQSARVDKVWLDEEHPESVWDEIQPRLLRYGGTTLGSMTPLKGQTTFIYGRIYEPLKRGSIEAARHWYSHAGASENPGLTEASIDEMREELKHNPAQLEARLYGHFTKPTGSVLPWDAEKHLTPTELDVDSNEMIIARVRYSWYGALDLGKWRFAFVFGCADRDGNFLVVDEYFSQNEDASVRAKGMHDRLKAWRVPDTIQIPADCADPKGIKELNEAFEALDPPSPYRVYAIAGELKSKTTGIARVENLLNRGALKVRRGMAADRVWALRKNAAGPGRPIIGSRWMWEASSWVYPTMPDGKVQKDEPDDASADGADMMDATRYLVVSFFPADPLPKAKKNPTVMERIQKELEDLDKQDPDLNPKDSDRFGGTLRQ